MSWCHACNKKPCRCIDVNGKRQPYMDEALCDHDYDEDEEAGEFVCVLCGHREPFDLTQLIK